MSQLLRKARPTAHWALALLLLAAAGSADERLPFSPPDEPPHYMPERQYDLRHLRLDLAFDWEKREVSGTATNTLAPLRPGLDTLVFHAADLDVSRVRLAKTGEELPFSVDPRAETLTVRLGRAYGPEDVLDVAITYSARPKEALYFVGPDAGYPDKPRQIYSQGEPDYNRSWFPSWDYPNDRATSELIGTVERPFQLISNGRLVEVAERPDGRRTFHWSMEQPHTTYLVSVVISEFSRIADAWRGVPVEYYVPPGREEEARIAFGKTPEMMEYFSTVTGQPYPYAKYAQTTVYDYMWGGMENISATTQTERTLHDQRAEPDYSSEDLVAHELAHQWFGDLVTCRSWDHIWLNEGFADYFTALYKGHAHGDDALVYEMDDLRKGYLEEDSGEYRRPIVTPTYTDPIRMFDSHTYQKGALVLHMVRYLAGDEAWWRGIREYLQRFKLQTVTTADFQTAMEQVSGVSLGPLFDQYVYRAGHPELALRWNWDPERRLVRLEAEQRQTAETGLFSFPVEVALVGETGDGKPEIRRVLLEAKRFQDLYLPSDSRPRTVVFDPHGWMLKTLDFDKPVAEWVVQLETADHVAAKLEALRALGDLGGGMAEGEAEAALGKALREEPFYGVRAVAAEALGKLATDAALKALQPGLADRDSQVRTAALGALKTFPEHRELIAVLRRALEGDESWAARAAAAKALGGFEKFRGEVEPALVRALSQKSFRDVVLEAAIQSLADIQSPRTLELASRYARYGAPTHSRDNAMRALAQYAARQDDPEVRAEARRILEGYLTEPVYTVRGSLYTALAELEDPAVLPALERSARNEVDARQRIRAEEAIQKIRARQTEAAAAQGDLAGRIQQLEREAEVLRQRIEEMEGKEEATEQKGAEGRPH